jgi:hypothetical protein
VSCKFFILCVVDIGLCLCERYGLPSVEMCVDLGEDR